jgi:lysophospholipase L1-like esterase
MLWRRLEGSTVEVDENVRRVPPEERLRLLGELRALCAQNDLRLVVAIPWYREFDEHAPLLRAAAAHLGIATVDLPRILANRSGQIGAYFVDPVHPNARGHRLIARALTTGLRGEWAQPAATGRN